MKPPVTSCRYAILGAGAWGTALALALARGGLQPVLWAREPEVLRSVEVYRENKPFLPGIALSTAIHVTGDLQKTLEDAECVILAMGAQYLRPFLHANPLLSHRLLIITCKGIEAGTGLLIPEILAQEMPEASWCLLSGPTLAHEVALGKPTLAMLASNPHHPGYRASRALRHDLIQQLSHTPLRLIPSDDVIGTAVGGALKNIFAIGAGLIADLGLNAAAALLCHGLREMQLLAKALGGLPETLLGPAGLGDLLLTTQSPLSRNRMFGVALAKGKSVETILGSQALTEGVVTSRALQDRLIQLQEKSVVNGSDALITPQPSLESQSLKPSPLYLPLATQVHQLIEAPSPQGVEKLQHFLLNHTTCFSTGYVKA